MKVKRIAECSPWRGAFCNILDLHLAIMDPENQLFGLFESGRFTLVA